jgi:hypothetical protein
MLAATTLPASTTIPAASAAAVASGPAPNPHVLRQKIAHNRSLAVHRGIWLGLLLRHGHAERHTSSPMALAALLHRWKHRRIAFGRALHRRAGVYQALLCIHRGEGAWTAYSSAGPYYGGLQMNRGFELTYGAEFVRRFGDAQRWKPGLQIAVGYRAVRQLGFSPWPATRLGCGV